MDQSLRLRLIMFWIFCRFALMMADDRANGEEMSIFCSSATVTMCSAAVHHDRCTA